MAIHEECGVFGVIAPAGGKVNPAATVYPGLFALQHRGQESCGIVVNAGGAFTSHKDLGLVAEVFDRRTLAALGQGDMAVGHVRYGTTGATSRSNCQPIEVNHRMGRMAIAHNGNLSNAAALRERLELSGAIFHATSDTEIIAYLLTRERLGVPTLDEALSRVFPVMEGAYSLIIMSHNKLICCRDVRGFRPLSFGVCPDGSYVAASETAALAAVGARFVRDVEPGEILVLEQDPDTNGVRITSRREHCGKVAKRLCAFEYIYFARPDSVLDGVPVHGARVRAGEILAREHPVAADVVIGVPDSGLDAALGFARASGIPYEVGLIKNKYIGRTFIAPEQAYRMALVRMKLSPVAETVAGKRVVLVDDSIVRGTTGECIVRLLREAGAAEIHMRISAPPFLHPCYYGTDIDSEENLIATHHTPAEIAALMGADSLGYLPVAALTEMIGDGDHCSACFDGDYPTAVPAATRKDAFE